MTKYKFIVNPYAGRGAGAKLKERLRAATSKGALQYDLVLTEAPGHAVELARAAAESHDVVVAVGGDGTVHEVVNGLAQAADGGVTATLGVVPIGSGDDFAFAVGLPRHRIDAAIATIARGRTRLVDLGRLNDRFFANEVGVAFEGQVNVESRRITAPLGPLLYLIAVFRALTRYELPRMRVQWEGGVIDRQLLMVSVANGRRAGGAFLVAPDAQPDDGHFDILIADALGRLPILRLLPKVMRGTHTREKPVTMVRTPRLTIDASVGVPVHADGELVYTEARHLEFEILPGRLRVLA